MCVWMYQAPAELIASWNATFAHRRHLQVCDRQVGRRSGRGGCLTWLSRRNLPPRRKFCRFCADKDLPLDYKRADILRDFITERGKIIARRITGTCAHHQRLLTREIKRARQMALLIYTATHDSGVKKKSTI